MNPVPKSLNWRDLQQLMPFAMTWAFSVNANDLASGKPLSLRQAADAVEVGVKKPDSVRILQLKALPETDCADLRQGAQESGRI